MAGWKKKRWGGHPDGPTQWRPQLSPEKRSSTFYDGDGNRTVTPGMVEVAHSGVCLKGSGGTHLMSSLPAFCTKGRHTGRNQGV